MLTLHYEEWSGKAVIRKMTFYLHGKFSSMSIRKNIISPLIEMQPLESEQNATIPCILRLKAVETLSRKVKSLFCKSAIGNLQIIIFETDQEFRSSF